MLRSQTLIMETHTVPETSVICNQMAHGWRLENNLSTTGLHKFMHHILPQNDNYFHLAGECSHSVWELLGSNLIQIMIFLRPLNKCRYSTRPRLLPSKSVPIHYSSIVLPYDAIQSLIPTEPKDKFRNATRPSTTSPDWPTWRVTHLLWMAVSDPYNMQRNGSNSISGKPVMLNHSTSVWTW
jgi:hypothetical protein